MTLEQAKAYIERISHRTDEQKQLNQRAWQDALNLSAWISLADYGNPGAREYALKVIKSI
jgi:hypothetical protein